MFMLVKQPYEIYFYSYVINLKYLIQKDDSSQSNQRRVIFGHFYLELSFFQYNEFLPWINQCITFDIIDFHNILNCCVEAFCKTP